MFGLELDYTWVMRVNAFIEHISVISFSNVLHLISQACHF